MMNSALPAFRKWTGARWPTLGLLSYCLLLLMSSFVNADTPERDTLANALPPIIAGSWRSEQNRARDRYRHPVETLEFFNLRPDAMLIEITPGAGWFTEILAPLLHDHGAYYAAVVDPDKAPLLHRSLQTEARDKLRDKFKNDPQHYSKATILEFDPSQPVFGKPASADVVVTFRNVHNWVKSGNETAYFRAFFNVLKPGGILGVEDHRAKPGSALDNDSGYLPEDYVIKLASDAGFKLAARSEVNANPADTKNYAKGVWTLPPTLALGDEDKAKYLAIGESDRFTLRFIKPIK